MTIDDFLQAIIADPLHVDATWCCRSAWRYWLDAGFRNDHISYRIV